MRSHSVIVLALWASAAPATSGVAQPVDCVLPEATGFTEPSARVEVAAREPGIVASMHVEPGDRVRSGEVLAELDKTLAQAELDGARARAEAGGRLAMATAKLDLAGRKMAELSKLEASRAVRPLEMLNAEAELAIARAEVRSVEDDMHIAALTAQSAATKLSLLDVKAPFDGVVDQVHRQPSEFAGAGGDARIVTMLKLDRLHADFFVPAGCIGPVERGHPVEVSLPRLGLRVSAQIRDLGQEIDAPTGLRRIGIEIDNENYKVLGGERLSLRLPMGGLER